MPHLARKEEKVGQRYPHNQKRGEIKRGNPTGVKGKGSLRFAFLEPSGEDPIAAEVSGNQVNVATRHVNLSDILGDGAWGNQNQPDERSIIIDT